MKKKYHLKQKTVSLAVVIPLVLGSLGASDLTFAKEKISNPPAPSCPSTTKWNYLTSYNTSNGKPNGMTDSTSVIPSNIVSRFLTLLPEGKNITTNPTTNALITDDFGGNVFITKTTKIKVAFLTEGAGYSNAVGFFKFDKDKLPKPCITDEKIIFPNSSTPPMNLGNTVDLGTFQAGDSIGFTVVANGWSSGSVKTNKPDTGIFRSVMALNPEAAPKNPHTVLLSSPSDKMLIIGFEDLNRENRSYNDYRYRTDNDFNDVILAIIPDDFSAIDTSDVADVDTGETGGDDTGGGDDTDGGGDTGGGGTGVAKPVGFSGRMNWREKVDMQSEGGQQQQTEESTSQSPE